MARADESELAKVREMAHKSMTAEIDGGHGTVTIDRLARHNGVAGQISVEITATYRWADDDSTETLTSTLVGSSYGAPIVAILSSGAQTFVRNPERFGAFESDPVEYARRYMLNEL